MTAETPKEAARRFAAPVLAKGFVPQALHEYRDAKGAPLYWRIRAKHPQTGEKWIRPMYPNGDAYELAEPDFTSGKPLYRLYELTVHPGAPVWYVEGEGCADALAKLGMLATTAGGANSDDTADYSPLAGRTVSIWPDNDAPGIAHAERVAAKLRAIGCSVEILDARALGLKAGGDCVDWLKVHPGVTSANLAKLPRVRADARSHGDTPLTVELISGADVRPKPIEWLWEGWIAAGKLHIIAGAPEAGKTSIALALAAMLTIGGCWPDGTRVAPGIVIIWSGEDSIEDTLTPRLLALGAEMTRVRFVRRVADPEGMRPFDPARDMLALQGALAGIGAKLVIVDPIVSAVTGDSHENAKVRRALQPIVDLAETIGCAVLGISHFSKGTGGRDPVERVTGSVAFGALPRLVFAAAKRPEEEGGGRIFVRAKSNIGVSGGGYEYRIEGAEISGGIRTSRLLFGKPLTGTARELLAVAETVEEPGERSATADAVDMLSELLADGPMRASEAQSKLKGAGFTDKQIRSARERLKVKPKRKGFGPDSVFFWTLTGLDSELHRCPDSPLMPIDALPQREGNNDINRATMGGEEASDEERF